MAFLRSALSVARPSCRACAGSLPYPIAPSTASFCDRLASSNAYDYTNAADEHALMLQLVSRAYNGAAKDLTKNPPVISSVQGLLQNANTVKYFNGDVNYRVAGTPYYPAPTPSYTSNSYEASALDTKLAAWVSLPAHHTRSHTHPSSLVLVHTSSFVCNHGGRHQQVRGDHRSPAVAFASLRCCRLTLACIAFPRAVR